MRQIGDLLVWMAMIAAVLAVLYLTPRVACYLSDDMRPSPGSSRFQALAFAGSQADPGPGD